MVNSVYNTLLHTSMNIFHTVRHTLGLPCNEQEAVVSDFNHFPNYSDSSDLSSDDTTEQEDYHSALSFVTARSDNAVVVARSRKFIVPRFPLSEGESPIQWLSPEVLQSIFRCLSPMDLHRASHVCREWKVLAVDDVLWRAFDIKALFPCLKIIDKSVWEKCVDLDAWGLDFSDEEPLNYRIVILELTRLFATLMIQENAGIALVTMPSGHSYPKLKKFASSPKKGNKTKFASISNDVGEQGNIPLSKTVTFAMTNSILTGSRGFLVSFHETRAKKLGCQIPEFLAVSTLIVLTHMDSPPECPTLLYSLRPASFNREQGIFTRCIERLNGYPMIVGGLYSGKLRVAHYDAYGKDKHGLALQRNF